MERLKLRKRERELYDQVLDREGLTVTIKPSVRDQNRAKKLLRVSRYIKSKLDSNGLILFLYFKETQLY